MKLIYELKTIENIINALDTIPIVGIKSAEIITYVVQELSKNQQFKSKMYEI